MPLTLTRREFADLIQRHPERVSYLIARDRIVLTHDGRRVLVEASLRRMLDTAAKGTPFDLQSIDKVYAASELRNANGRKGGPRVRRARAPIAPPRIVAQDELEAQATSAFNLLTQAREENFRLLMALRRITAATDLASAQTTATAAIMFAEGR